MKNDMLKNYVNGLLTNNPDIAQEHPKATDLRSKKTDQGVSTLPKRFLLTTLEHKELPVSALTCSVKASLLKEEIWELTIKGFFC